MIIQIRGPYKTATLADQILQLTKIGSKALVYKTTLGIIQADIDRIVAADLMNKFVANAKQQVEGWMAGLNAYNDQLHSGDILQTMNAFQGLPGLGVAPANTFAGIWHFIDKRRAVWMKHDNWTDAIGEDMGLLGPITNFNTDNYTPEIVIDIFPTYIQIKTDSAIIKEHNLNVGTSNITPIPFITKFTGSTYKYYRILPPAVTSEKLDVTLQGVYQNATIGHVSATKTIAYKG